MELWDVYDKNRNRTGNTMERGSAFAKGDYHLVIHVCIFNSQGQMLIQQRQPWKEGWPNLWDVTVGGSAQVGEDSAMAAERETLEEIGYQIDLSEERPFLTVNFRTGFDDYYLLEREIALEELTLQQEEVQAVKWASEDEILKMIEKGVFISYHRTMIEMLFLMRLCRGTVRI